MIEVRESVVIDLPPGEVFAYAGDPTNDPAWANVIIESVITSTGALAKGSRARQVTRFLGVRTTTHCEVTEYEPGRRLAFRIFAGTAHGDHERTFEPVDGGTRMTMATRGDSGGLFQLVDPLVQRAGQRQMATDLANLKDLLESGAAAG